MVHPKYPNISEMLCSHCHGNGTVTAICACGCGATKYVVCGQCHGSGMQRGSYSEPIWIRPHAPLTTDPYIITHKHLVDYSQLPYCSSTTATL